ncbi:spore germination protein [Metabacillus litoralis]|uniref:spore germination protein n=1 Tax=Metabacillus litoralis TaxID=152268 RepID=UPI00299DFBD7|nr:spore germination protein [Metabacillus litoralis]
MFGFLRRNAHFQHHEQKKRPELDETKEDFSPQLFLNIEKNIENIAKMLNSPNDLVVRRLMIGHTKMALFYFDGLIDKKSVNEFVIKNIQSEMTQLEVIATNTEELLKHLQNEILSISEVATIHTLDDMSLAILSGDTALMIDGEQDVLIIGTKGWESRSIEEPTTEALVRGPRDGFTENIGTNLVHLRRRIRDPNLRFEQFKVGRRSKKSLVLSYIDGIVHPQIVKEVRRRVNSIDLDDVPESGYVEQWIEDDFLSPFPQLQNTERPDKVSAGLMQGKVAIFLDGTPFVLLAPLTFAETLQSPEDYYERWYIGSLIRALRYFCAFIALFLPSLYVALVSFHPGMIPSNLAFSISSTREGVPFPSFIEAVFMEITMEILREAGIRLPKPIGQTVGIVGGLVIGEAAVSAGIVSPIMVIVVAVTAISTFAIPFYSFAISIRMLRFFFLIVASIFGFYGIILAYIIINIHLANLKSMGVPYTTPFAPSIYSDWKDLVIRAPLTFFTKRPQYMQTEDDKRMGE